MAKVAIFVNSLSGGGMERAMLNLANHFAINGLDVDLLVASKKGQLLTEVTENINLIDLKNYRSSRKSIRLWLLKSLLSVEYLFFILMFIWKLPKAIKVIPSLAEYIDDHSPDVIMSTPTTANLALIWASSYCKFDNKVFLREASTLSQELKHKRSLFFRMIKRFVSKWYDKSDGVICVSEGVRQDLISNFSVQSSKLHFLYNIIDIEGIKKRSMSCEYKDQINNYGKYILSVGRLEKQKDFETLIRAFKLIVDRTNCNLVILGEGAERQSLEKLIEDLSLSGRVEMPGYYVNPYPFIKYCEVLALSSRWEGCPNVLREALVLQKKIVSTDCPSGVRELLEGGKWGALVEIGDVDHYSRELEKMINSKFIPNNSKAEEMNFEAIRHYKELLQV
ncbi:MAG: glycosyltransferase [Gammaproteobacteria bacterium]|nr:glycosyltransferase [Gammaproteobacteria bacterium]